MRLSKNFTLTALTVMAALGVTAMTYTTSPAATTAASSQQDSIVAEASQVDSTVTATPEIANPNYIDEVLWVVGDEAILRSDVEVMRIQGEQDGMEWNGDPDIRIPEYLAVQKLFLNQAALDSIEVTESEISEGVEQQINAWIQYAGSKEKLEEYQGKSIAQMRSSLHDDYKNRELVNRMRQQLVQDVKVTPAEVRDYFRKLPEDSIPFVPMTVEVQILTYQPRIPIEETNKVKDQLRDFTDRVQQGKTSFGALARLYSEDTESARQGGELGYIGRGSLDPAFAQVAFNLTDPKKVSKIVESEFGYHIIQLIDKRGDKINCRHILLKPRVPQEAIDAALARMDSIATDIRDGQFTFDEGATVISDDKDTRNNRGMMSTYTEDGDRTNRFEMKDLPTEVARVVDTLKVGQVSAPFTMINKRGKTTTAIIKLKARTEGHKAVITEDFPLLSNIVLNKRKNEVLREWVQKKIRNTYVRMDDRYKDGDFEYEGWIH